MKNVKERQINLMTCIKRASGLKCIGCNLQCDIMFKLVCKCKPQEQNYIHHVVCILYCMCSSSHPLCLVLLYHIGAHSSWLNFIQYFKKRNIAIMKSLFFFFFLQQWHCSSVWVIRNDYNYSSALCDLFHAFLAQHSDRIRCRDVEMFAQCRSVLLSRLPGCLFAADMHVPAVPLAALSSKGFGIGCNCARNSWAPVISCFACAMTCY